MNKELKIMYLHGFASGPGSKKAQFFKKKLKIHGYHLFIPDLNVPSFENLSLFEMVDKVKQLIAEQKSGEWVILCSSLGALAAIGAARYEPKIKKIVMLAPAFGFNKRREALLGKEQISKWEHEGKIEIFHNAFNKNMPISYSFIEELNKEDEYDFNREIPIKIFHGAFDETVPIEMVEKFIVSRKLTDFHLLESDHSLFNKMDWIWRDLIKFIPIE